MQPKGRTTPMFRMRPAPVLPEMVDCHLQEAAFATMQRRRMIAETNHKTPQVHETSLLALRRQEDLLRAHLTGLSSIWGARLEQRIAKILFEAKATTVIEMHFVAAFLLLRCARVRWERRIKQLAADAKNIEVRTLLLEAIELTTPRLLTGLQSIPTDKIHERQSVDRLLRQRLREGACALSLNEAHHLALFAPELLCSLTRSALKEQAKISQLQMNAFAAFITPSNQHCDADLAMLAEAIKAPAYTQQVLRALWLTGRADAASIYLRCAQTHQNPSVRELAAAGFEKVVGIAIPQDDASEKQREAADFNSFVERYENRRILGHFAEPAFWGQPRDTQSMIDYAHALTIGEWHALLLLIGSHSRGRCVISTRSFCDVQVALLKANASLCDQALFDTSSARARPGYSSADESLLRGRTPA